MPTPHAHDQDHVDGPPAPPLAHPPVEPPARPFTMQPPRREGDPASAPTTDQDRLQMALRALNDARAGLDNRHPETVHNPHPNDLDRARQVLEAAIDVVRATTRNVIEPIDVRDPGRERELVEERLGVHAAHVMDLLPPGAGAVVATAVRGHRFRDGTPGVYVEGRYGAEWEHPEDISESGWATVTYSVQAEPDPEAPDQMPIAHSEGYAPRAALAGLAAHVKGQDDRLDSIVEQLDYLRAALSQGTTQLALAGVDPRRLPRRSVRRMIHGPEIAAMLDHETESGTGQPLPEDALTHAEDL